MKLLDDDSLKSKGDTKPWRTLPAGFVNSVTA